MGLPRITVMTDGKNPTSGARVFVDGHEITGLIRVDFDLSAESVNHVTLVLIGYVETVNYEKKEPYANS